MFQEKCCQGKNFSELKESKSGDKHYLEMEGREKERYNEIDRERAKERRGRRRILSFSLWHLSEEKEGEKREIE